jgi:hypothetical protein
VSYDGLLARTSFVIYRPGTPSSGLAVATWNEVKAFIALRDGAVVVLVDASLVGGSAHVPAASGITDGQRRTWLRGANNNDFLIVDDGATLFDFCGVERSLDLQFDTQGATPGLDFTWAEVPEFFIRDYGSISTTTTATTPACIVPDASLGIFSLTTQGEAFLRGASVLVQLAGAASALYVYAQTSAFVSGDFVAGPGTLNFEYDSSTVTVTAFSGLPTFAGVGTYVPTQLDTNTVVLDFTANASDVLAFLVAAGRLPSVGTTLATIEGYGGGSSGAGGATGSGAAPGAGGAGGAGSFYQCVTMEIDLTKTLNVTVGAGGTPAAADASGVDGSSSLVTNGTGIGAKLLAALAGATFSGQAAGSSGGPGGAAGVPGSNATINYTGIQGSSPLGPGPTGLWSAGAGGPSGAGGGGGGGGAGIRGSTLGAGGGGAGGQGGGVGNPGLPGGDGAPNTGAGSGGGGGGDTMQAGGPSGQAGSGWVRLSVMVPGP